MSARITPLVYLVLLALAVPWYWPESDDAVWFGVPAWVCAAVIVSLAASVLTALLLARPWPDESPHQDAARDE